MGAYLVAYYEPGADCAFDTRVASPVLGGLRPRVLFDHGHRNAHSAHGRYGPFVRLIKADGCRVTSSAAPFSAKLLESADILIVVNARGRDSDSLGLANDPNTAAFTPTECDVVRDWVWGGGALLLVADHHPYGEAAAALASRFGVEMSGGWTDDEASARPNSGDPGQIVFARPAGSLGDHAITRGLSTIPEVSTVETFTGQSLLGPPDATSLLILAASAVDRVPTSAKREMHGSNTTVTFETEDRSAAGRCQGLALRFGKGRIVVLGEAALLTAQVDARTGRRFGMNSPGNDNRAFALNTVRWLAGALE